MFKTQDPYAVENYFGIKGINYLKLNSYEKKGRLVRKHKCYAVIKDKTGKERIIFACLLPNLSMRLIISPNDDTNIEEDNSYADEIVGYLNIQLEKCWRVLPQLIDRREMQYLYVRKFERFTCSLLLCGNDDSALAPRHEMPMRKQLHNMKKSNFDLKQFDKVRNIFPRQDLHNMATPREYNCIGCNCYKPR